ncbi:MAG: HAD-IIB family hydrolase [Brevinema sp.]
MKKLLACDIDGTILHHQPNGRATDYIVAQEDIEAIREFRKQGHFFTFCTGRTLLGVKAVLDEFPIEADAAIISGGARLHRFIHQNPLTTEHLLDFCLPADVAKDIISHFYSRGDCVIYWSDGHNDYAFADRMSDWMKENSPSIISLDEWLSQPRDVSSIGLTPSDNHQSWMKNVVNEIKNIWGNDLECHQNLVTLDICLKGVNKGSGLSHMHRILGGEHQCYAIGDALNDLPMFMEAGSSNAYLRDGGNHELLPYVKQSVSSVAHCIYDILED